MQDHRDTRRYQDGGSSNRRIDGLDSTAGPPAGLGQSVFVSVPFSHTGLISQRALVEGTAIAMAPPAGLE